MVETSLEKRTYSRLAVASKQLKIISFLLAFVFSIFVYGMIPYFALSTHWQVIWTSGFAQSFVNQGWPSIYATNFGLPVLAPMAFGLPGGFLQSTLMVFFHMSAAPAYAFMVDIYLLLALWGALKLNQLLGLRYYLALLMAVAWLATPMVWAHAAYSMLSLGFALLPFYLWVTLLLFSALEQPINLRASAIIFVFVLTCILASFMDGYSFMMFSCTVFILFGFAFLLKYHSRVKLLTRVLPVVLIGIFLSYYLYTLYLGKNSFPSPSLDFFRGYGLDITSIFFPQKGIYWFWDLLNLGVTRIAAENFGNPIIWYTSFSAVFIFLGILGFLFGRARYFFTYSFALMALFGTYMALGPSLKFNALRPTEHLLKVEKKENSFMPAEYAIAPTGNAIFSQKLIGFKNMRASYRWMALGLLGFWGLTALFMRGLQDRDKQGWAHLLSVFLIILNLPGKNYPFPDRYFSPILMKSFERLQNDFIFNLSKNMEPNSIAVFAPYYLGNRTNDFIAAYLASAAHFRIYNSGGDKNVMIARQAWPKNIKALMAADPDHILPPIQDVLLSGTANYVIIPFFNSLYDSNIWPPSEEKVLLAQKGYQKVLNSLQTDPDFKVVYEDYYAIVNLNPSTSPTHIAIRAKSFNDKLINLSLNKKMVIGHLENKMKTSLGENWYDIAPTGVWSKDHATLSMYVDPKCQKTACALKLNFQVFYAYPERPSVVDFYSKKTGAKLYSKTLSDENNTLVTIPFKKEDLTPDGRLALKFDVSNAVSGKKIGVNEDDRVMGMGLIDMSLEEAHS